MSPRVTVLTGLPVTALAAALLLAASHLALSRDHDPATVPAVPVAAAVPQGGPPSLIATSWSDPPARPERAPVAGPTNAGASPTTATAMAEPLAAAAEAAPAARVPTPQKLRDAKAEKRRLAARRPRREPVRPPELGPRDATVVAALEPAPRPRTGGPLGDILRGLGLEDDPGRYR